MVNKYDMLKRYIDDLATVDNRYEPASQIADTDEGKYADFWYDNDSNSYRCTLSWIDGHGNLVFDEEYYGDDELIDVNDIPLNAEELYSVITSHVKDFDPDFYGLRAVFDKDEEYYRDVTSNTAITCSSDIEILGPYAEWYKVAAPEDLAEWGYREKDVDFTDALDDYELEFLGTAVIDANKIDEDVEDALVNEGYDLLAIGRRYDNGEVGLFYTIGDSVIDVNIKEIERVLDFYR